MNHQLYEVELADAEVRPNEQVVVGLFVLRKAKLRMLELAYMFFDKLGDFNNFEELETGTESLYLALAENELIDCIQPEMSTEWERLRSTECDYSFAADVSGKFFLEPVARNTRSMIRRSPVSSKNNSVLPTCSVFVVNFADTILPPTSWKTAANVSIGGH